MPDEQLHIFYADDDADDIAIFSEAVEIASQDINLVTHFDGGDLLHLLHNPPPSPAMVFLDWNMPGRDGASVLKSIRETEQISQTPVIILSTSDYVGNINKAHELGANLYIVKPNSFKHLVNTIKHCLTIDWPTFQPKIENFILKI